MAKALSLSELIKHQNLVITRRQAVGCGMKPDTVYRRAKAGGPWQQILPGVYLTVTGTPTRDQRDTAAVLYGGPGATLTGAAALRWYGVRAGSDSVDLLVPANRAPRSTGFVVIHRTTKLPQWVCSSGPVRYALAARAVADAARDMHDLREVRAVVAGAVQRGHCTIAQLEVELTDGPRNGSALLRTVLAEVGLGVRSPAEGDLLDLIKRGRLPMPMMN